MSEPSSGSGGSTNAKAKYCLKCDRQIRKRREKYQALPRRIGPDLVDTAVKYLCENGKQCTKENVEGSYFCNPCYLKLYKLRPNEDRKKYNVKPTTPRPEDVASTSTVVPPAAPPAQPATTAGTTAPARNHAPHDDDRTGSNTGASKYYHFVVHSSPEETQLF